MKLADRIRVLEGVTDAHWDAKQNRLVVFYSSLIPLDTVKVRVAGAIGDANLQQAIEKITLISVTP